MRLWSVVVNQPSRPGRGAQIRSRRLTYVSPSRVTAVAMSFSLEALQVGDHLVHLRVGETEVGHQHTRLDRLWVVDPGGQVRGCVGERVGGDRGTVAEVREVWADCTTRAGAADRVAAGALAGHEHVLAGGLHWGGRRGS